VGIAWLDDEEVEMDAVALRTGGLPLLTPERAWPECPNCGLPMLFRGQVPLSLTGLVPFDDPRVLLIFECHAEPGGHGCLEGEAMIVQGELSLVQPPAVEILDVWLESFGAQPKQALRLAAALAAADFAEGPEESWDLPFVVMQACPRYIAEEAQRALRYVGARVSLKPSAPTTLSRCHGGRLMPFDDGRPGLARTTLPAMNGLIEAAQGGTMRGLLAGDTPGYRDHSFHCSCGRPTRTALRLLAHREPAGGPRLGPAIVQVCPRCDKAWLHRSTMH